MASVFKRERDKGRKGSSYYISYQDANGRRRSVKGCPDKAASEALARKLESESELRRRGVIDARDDAFAEHERKPLVDHIEDYHNYLEARGSSKDHAPTVRARATKIIELGRMARISDITPSRFQSALAAVRANGAALRTVHHYTRQFKGFSRWLVKDGRARFDPVAYVSPINPDPDRRRERRSLSGVELGRIVRAAESGATRYGLSGPDRAMLYRIAMGTGFRRGELASLTPRSFRLDENPPVVTVAAGYSKRRREDVQPIRPELADVLRPWLASRPADAPLFGKLTPNTADMLRVDLATAGVPYADDSGHVADFHALRHSFISALAMSGASVKAVQSLARHSTPTLTFGVYAHAGLFDLAGALDGLPEVESAARPAALSATGTDSVTPECHALPSLCHREPFGTRRRSSRSVAKPQAAAPMIVEREPDRNPFGDNGNGADCRALSDSAVMAGVDGNRTHRGHVSMPPTGFEDQSKTGEILCPSRGCDKLPSLAIALPPPPRMAADPDLAAIAEAWPNLPDAIREAISGLARSGAAKRPSGRGRRAD